MNNGLFVLNNSILRPTATDGHGLFGTIEEREIRWSEGASSCPLCTGSEGDYWEPILMPSLKNSCTMDSKISGEAN